MRLAMRWIGIKLQGSYACCIAEHCVEEARLARTSVSASDLGLWAKASGSGDRTSKIASSPT